MTELKLLQCRLDSRYDIEDCLGRGSYAEIYLARDTAATDERFRTVVIKALNVLLQGYQDPELEATLIQNFQNEAVALDRVRHPNIISRLGHGTAIDLSGTAFHYLVLEYLSGGDLAKLCRAEPLTLERALKYLQQVCAGLAHAHECGVIHRDIKPQNLLLTADGETVKIADFGVDLNDVPMPVTQPLAGAQPRHSITSDLNVDEVLTAAAPPRPRFETSHELKQQAVADGRLRPRLVVPIRGAQPAGLAQKFAALESGRVKVPIAQNGLPQRSAASIVAAKSRRQGPDFVVGFDPGSCFLGLVI